MTKKTPFTLTRRHVLATATAAALAAMTGIAPAHAADTIKIGLIASLSGPSAKSGEAITRGLTVAIDEINAAGGLLGKQVELLRRDDENNPGKGLVAARELVQREKVAVLFGGLQTPVSLAIVPFMNQSKAVFMGPWAAGTPITQNGAKENYIFRVSAFDSMVGVALVDRAVAVHGAKKPGMMLINNPWGESNEKSLLAALKVKGMEKAGIEKNRTVRHRRGPAVNPPQIQRRRCDLHGRQRRPIGTGHEVARTDELERTGCLALGSGWWSFLRTRRATCEGRGNDPNLHVLRQPVAESRRDDGEVEKALPGNQRRSRCNPCCGYRQRL